MKSLKIGEIQGGYAVTISKESPNQHILLSGTSGSGKSTRIRQIINNAAVNGETVIVFDQNGCDYSMMPGVCHISAMKDGLGRLLLGEWNQLQNTQDRSNYLSFWVENFSMLFNLGVRQMGALREGMYHAMTHAGEYKDDMSALAEGLLGQNSSVASGVYNKIWDFLQCHIFCKSSKKLQARQINVISFEGINAQTQKVMIELILAKMWQKCRHGRNKDDLRIVIDEFQNLSLKPRSLLLEMLRESRKYRIGIILATQSTAALTKDVMAAVNLSAVQMYFRQTASDVKKIAEFIDAQNSGRWVLQLKKLKIGESVATGDFCIGDKMVSHPVVIHPCRQQNNTISK